MGLASVTDFGPAVAIFMFVAFLVFVLILGLMTHGRRRGNLEEVANRFQGRVTSSWLSGTDLELAVDGVPASLSYHPGSKNSSAYTRMRFDAVPGGRLRVVPEGLWESLKRAFGAEDLQVGDAGFDRAFVIQGAPVVWVRRVLDDATRGRLTGFLNLGGGWFSSSGASLEAGPGGIMVSVPRNLVNDPEVLERFVSESIEIFRQVRAGKESAIVFLSSAECAKQGRCPVCEHPFEGKLRNCEACATPHHAECWDYFGGCSTYACTSRGGRARP